MNIKKLATVAVLVLSTTACAGGYAGDRYTPVIDVHGSPGKNPAAYAGDLNQCQVLAAQRPQAQDAIKGTGVGAVIGGAGGAIVGAMVGDPLTGAGLGAAGGALAGGAGSGLKGNINRQDIVIQCMGNRGWKILSR